MEKIRGRGGSKIAEAMENIVSIVLSTQWPSALKSGLSEHHKGGILTIRNRNTPSTRSQWIIGNPPEINMMRYTLLSEEKGRRLYWMIHKGNSTQRLHLSSWQSRNQEKDHWGGAILTKDDIVSFSGMPELVDEALVLISSVALRKITPRRAAQIANASHNENYWGIIGLILR